MSQWWNTIRDTFIQLYDDDVEQSPRKSKKNTVSKQQTQTREVNMNSPLQKPEQIALLQIESVDMEWLPANYLKSDRPVQVDLGNLSSKERDTVCNFLCGVVFALNGTVEKVRDDIFMFAPSEVGIITEHEEIFPHGEDEFLAGNLNPEDLLD